MIDIFICEDNKKQLNLFQKYISNLILMEGFDMQIVQATADPHVILKEIRTAENTGLFFLDIDLKSDMDGLALAQRIRQIQPRCFIVFITSHSEMSFLTFQYKAEALDFIVKDSTEHIKAKIHECLLDVSSKYTSLNNSITRTFTVVPQNKVPVSCTKTANYNSILTNTSLPLCRKKRRSFFLVHFIDFRYSYLCNPRKKRERTTPTTARSFSHP